MCTYTLTFNIRQTPSGLPVRPPLTLLCSAVYRRQLNYTRGLQEVSLIANILDMIFYVGLYCYFVGCGPY